MPGKRSIQLTREEARLAALVAQGLGNKEIAAALALALGAVESRVRRLRRRAGAATRVELALLAVASISNPGRRNKKLAAA